jgi:hypothetical protein
MKKLRNRINILPIAIIVCAVVGILGLFLERSFSGAESNVEANTGFAQAQRLAGQWIRTDGGYRLVIEDIRPDGSLKASYFNPRKINVHESNWEVQEDGVHLFVELRDVNYPGSKYNLVYINEKGVLNGTYFQAIAKGTYFVKFLKIPEDQN